MAPPEVLVTLASPLADLMDRLAAGDDAALGELYDATSSRVFGLILTILRNRAEAEEVTLDVYTQVWRTAARYETGRGAVATWLLAIARSRAIDRIRSRRRRRESETELGEREFVDPMPSPADNTEAGERASRVRAALGQLPKEQRRPLELAYFTGRSHTEVASVLGLPLGTVKSRIRAGLAALRAQLGPMVGELL